MNADDSELDPDLFTFDASKFKIFSDDEAKAKLYDLKLVISDPLAGSDAATALAEIPFSVDVKSIDFSAVFEKSLTLSEK